MLQKGISELFRGMVRGSLLLLVILFFVSPDVCAQAPNQWINPSQTYYRIPVAKEGLYRLTYTDLLNGGFPVNTVDPRLIQVFHRGQEQSIFFQHLQAPADSRFDSGEYLEFYGKKNDGARDAALYQPASLQPHLYYNLYTDTTAYFLTWNPLPVQGRRVTQFSEVNVGGLPAEGSHTAEQLRLLTSEYSGGYTEADYTQYSYFNEGEGWTGPVICTQSSGCTGQQDIVLENLTGRVTSASPPTGVVQLLGRDDLQHSAEIYAGPNSGALRLVGSANFEDFQVATISFNLNWSDIASDGRMVVRVRALGVGGVRDRLSVNYVKMNYAQNFDMAGQTERSFQLSARAGGKSFVEFLNCPANVRLWDVTDPTSITVIGLTSSGTTQRAVVPSTSSSRKLLLSSQVITPTFKRVSFRSFTGANPNYLIISHRSLMQPALGYNDPVKAYASYRASAEGGAFDTLTVSVDQLYNQFNYGETSPLAIYEFVKHIYRGGRLKHLFIIGKGREVFSGFHRLTTIPSTELRDLVPSAGYPASDLVFSVGLGSSPHLPAVATGRLTATNPTQVAVYLNKIKETESASYTDRWQKRVLHLSGGIQTYELPLFKQFMDGFASVARGQFYGGSVVTLGKHQATAIELINISKEVNEGVNLVTFFGHSSPNATDIDIGYASDPSMGYNNPGRYPAFLVNGCSAGDFFSNYFNFGEDWILAANKGARSFIANSSFGYASQLKYYSDLFYQSAFADSIGVRSGIGEVQLLTIDKFLKASTAMSSIALNHQMFLLGDPAVKLFGAGKPDFEAASVSSSDFTGQPVTAAVDSFLLKIVVKNFGLTTSKPLPVRVTQTFSDNASITHNASFPQPLFQDTLQFVIRRSGSRSLANNQFTIQLDPANVIEELSKGNNTATYTIVIPGTKNLFPHHFSIVRNTNAQFVFVNANPVTGTRQYELEVDTASIFNSGYLKKISITGKSLLRQSVQLLNTDSTVYYWRTKLVAASAGEVNEWQTSSFMYIAQGQEGWAQAEFDQFSQNTFTGLVKEPVVKALSFQQSSTDVFIRTFGSGNPATPADAALRIDGVDYWTSTQGFDCRDNTLNLVAFNKNTVVPYRGVAFTFQNSFGRACGREPQLINSFRSNEVSTGNNDDLVQYVNNVGAGDSVILFSMGDAGFQSYPAAAKNKLAELGISEAQLNELIPGEPVIILAKKGAPAGTARFIRTPLTPSVDQEVLFDDAVTGRFSSGSMHSVTIGPAKQWFSFKASTRADAQDEVRYNLYGIKADGAEQLIMANMAPQANLASVSATDYPFVRLEFVTSDNTTLTPAQLKKWFVFCESVPEGILMFRGNTSQQVFQEGISWTGNYSFLNISDKSFPDSLTVETSIYNQSRQSAAARSFKIKAPTPADSTIFQITNVPKAGLNEVVVFVNRRITPELFYENNNITLPNYLNVQADQLSPVLDVTVDGRYIADGDYVSPDPTFNIQLIDENPYLFKADTTGVDILIKSPCNGANCSFKRVALKSPQVSWTAATAQRNFHVVYTPKELANGEHTLRIQMEDATGNKAGAQPYEVRFVVQGETTIQFLPAHPNPSASSFVFPVVLSGKHDIEQLSLRVYGTDGRMINAYTPEEVSPNYVGTHYLVWDGKDREGNRAKSGVYIYELTVGTNGTMKSVKGKIVFLP